MNKADEQALVSLHGKLAEVLRDALAGSYKDEAGNAIPPGAAILNVARQFLKDNKIEVGATPKGSALGDLSDLPVFDDAGDDHHNMKYN